MGMPMSRVGRCRPAGLGVISESFNSVVSRPVLIFMEGPSCLYRPWCRECDDESFKESSGLKCQSNRFRSCSWLNARLVARPSLRNHVGYRCPCSVRSAGTC